MGYQITYTLKKEELDSSFIPLYKDLNSLNEEITKMKLELKLYSLMPADKDCNIANIIKDVDFKVKQYYFLLADYVKNYIYNSICKNGEVYFRQYANGNDFNKQFVINKITEGLCLYKLVIPTPNYISEDFYLKCNDIDELLDYQDVVFEIIYSQFKEKYYNKSDEYKNENSKKIEE